MDLIAIRKTDTLTFLDAKLYLLSAIFITANIITPIFLHQFGNLGKTLLPIYFFSIYAGLVYGWRAGLTTGLLSPLLSFILTSMPPATMLQFVVIKSIILGSVGGLIVEKFPKINLFTTTLIAIVSAQTFISIYIFLLTKNFSLSLSDLTVGLSGTLLQIIAIPKLAQLHFRNGN